DRRDVLELDTGVLRRLVEQGQRRHALRREAHAQALEVFEALELAAVDQTLADEHGLIEIARLRVPAVGDDAKLDPTHERVPEAHRKRAAADVELPSPHR